MSDDTLTLEIDSTFWDKKGPLKDFFSDSSRSDDVPSAYDKPLSSSFFKVSEIGFTKGMPRRENFENVISSLNIPGFKFLYYLKGSQKGVEFYLGVTCCTNSSPEGVTARSVAVALTETFKGNFHGSKLTEVGSKDGRVDEDDLFTSIFAPVFDSEYCTLIAGVPSVNKGGEGKDLYIQKMDHLVNSMGKAEGKWHLIIDFEACKKEEILASKEVVSKYYSTGHKNSKKQVSNSDSNTSSIREEIDKRRLQELEFLEKEVLEPLNIGLLKGYYKTGVFILAEDRTTHTRLKNNFTSIWQGDSSRINPLKNVDIDIKNDKNLFKILNFSKFETSVSDSNKKVNMLLSRIAQSGSKFELRTCLTSAELSLICSLPSKELPGLSLRESVEFGLNPKQVATFNCIPMGKIFHQGEVTENDLLLDRELLSRHVFIAGVTGSGKTVTCKRLLVESELPFLIIEPAKTEYRSLLGSVANLEVYTLGNSHIAPFRLNPFEILKGGSITQHVDMLKAAFSAAFPMEAAMPYLLEEAIYECYKDYGWNINGWGDAEDANQFTKDPWEANGRYWPTLDDLIKNLAVVVNRTKFGDRLGDEYLGSLVGRFNNLTVGAKGQMLNCRCSTDIRSMLDKKVVLELDDLKSPEDKSLMMGLLIGRFSEAIRLHHMENPHYKHITLIEEAHRLLERTMPGDGGSRKHAVGMFADLLAEVRKYGESLVIVDQIPNKLSPEVMKNTNTKIIHKLFARDDREAIGDTATLDTAQKDFLTRLRAGEIVVYSGDWDKAVHAKVTMEKIEELSPRNQELEVAAQGRNRLISNALDFYPELSLLTGSLTAKGVLIYSKVKPIFWNAVDQSVMTLNYEIKPQASATRIEKIKAVLAFIESYLSLDKDKLDGMQESLVCSIIFLLPLNKTELEVMRYKKAIIFVLNEILERGLKSRFGAQKQVVIDRLEEIKVMKNEPGKKSNAKLDALDNIVDLDDSWVIFFDCMSEIF